jgi:hypothetical protein
MTTEEIELFEVFKTNNLPINRGIHIEFLPSDKFLRELTKHFNIESASVFTCNAFGYCIYLGTRNSIRIPIQTSNKFEILLKHTHPSGSNLPSSHDINWLKDAESEGSPQVQSVILPIGKKRITFNKHSIHL